MIHNLYKQAVYLDEEQHRYFDQQEREYISFSKLFGFLSPKFEAEMIAGHVARSEGTTAKAVLNKWNNATEEGTRIDNALTLYSQTGQILESDRDLEPLIKHVLKKYEDYNACYEQLVVYSEEYRCAGSLDKLSLISNRKTSNFIISDFKVFAGGMAFEAKGQKWLNAPFDYLPNSKYVKISFQASYYAHLFEGLTGRKCERLFVDMIVPIKNEAGKVVKYRNEVVPLMYMKPQVELMLETFKDKIMNIVEPIVINQEMEVEDEF